MPLVEILTYISFISGGILVLLLILSIFAGFDFDFDFSTDVAGDLDSPDGLGLLKGGLTFVSVSSYVMKFLLALEYKALVAVLFGASAGIISVFILANIMLFLLSQESFVNWKPADAIEKKAKVYLKIPENNEGIIKVLISGSMRELKARSLENNIIATGKEVLVVDYDEVNEIAIVMEV